MTDFIAALITRLQTVTAAVSDTEVVQDVFPRVIVSAPTLKERRETIAGAKDIHDMVAVKVAGLSVASVRIITQKVRDALATPIDLEGWRMWLLDPSTGQVTSESSKPDDATSTVVFAATDRYELRATRK